jgi:Protein of unknown function (DUF3592)
MRRARRKDGAQIFAIVGGIFLAVGSLLLTTFTWGVPADFRIDQNQREVTGVVETSEADPTRRINRRPVQRIGYRYVFEGKSFRGELVTVSQDLVTTLRPGAPARLEVNAQAPEESRLVGQRLAWFGPWGMLLGVFPLVGVALLLTSVYYWLPRGER